MNRLILRSGFRHHVSRPGLLAASIAGIAIGVALVVSIDAAGSSARRAFTLSADAVSGRATHVIQPATGGLDEREHAALRRDGVDGLLPVVEGTVLTSTGPLRLLGVDPLADAGARELVQAAGFPSPAALLATEGGIVVSEGTALDRGWSTGDTVAVARGGVRSTVVVVGIVEPGDAVARQSWFGLAVADLSTAQEALQMVSRLTRIDVVADDSATVRRLERRLPAGLELRRAPARGETLAEMTRAFEVNLQALSYLALLVGLFLVYNIMAFSVARRRTVLGRLRAIGVDARTLRRLVLVEALALGLAGTALGLLLGTGLAAGLVRLVTRTINDLYFVVSVEQVEITAMTVLKGIGVGTGATLLAAWGPALRASRVAPVIEMRRSSEEERFRARFGLMVTLSAAMAILSVVLLIGGSGLVGGYAGLLAAVAAFACIAPPVVDLMARAVRAIAPASSVMRWAAGAVRTQLSRTSVAVAALALAVAASIGVGVMVQNFRATVETWLSYALQADIYVQPPSAVARGGTEVLLPEVERALRSDPAVRAAYSVRRVGIGTSAGPAALVALEHGPETRETFRFRATDGPDPWTAIDDGTHVWISEPFGHRHDLGVGDSLRVQTALGDRSLVISAVYYDYGSDMGSVLMGRPAYDRLFDDDAVSGLALFLEDGSRAQAVVERMRAATSPWQEVHVGTSAALRSASMEVFDRTFTVTWVLRLLAVVVAIVGILTTLSAQHLDRLREFGVLRAMGVGPAMLKRSVLAESGLMGAIAGLMAMPLGLVLSAGLVYVINRRSFGWTLQFDPSPVLLLQGLAVSVAAGVLAGWIPATRAARARPTRLLQGLLAAALVVVAGCARGPSGPAGVPLSEVLAVDTTGYTRVTAPVAIEFPRDHGPHGDHYLEWWYWTGNLEGDGGRRFGYQFTVFRTALKPPAERSPRSSAWAADQLYSAHFALTDVEGRRFHHSERFERAALGMAGAQAAPFAVWIRDWEASGTPGMDEVRIRADAGDFGVDLLLRPSKPVVLQGNQGFSRKGREEGQASLYYSLPRLETIGQVRVGDRTLAVEGSSWLDREWSTSLLSNDQVGWDWFSLQLDDDTDLMVFQLRDRAGAATWSDASSSGPDGRRLPVVADSMSIRAVGTWRSPSTGIEYPSGWIVTSSAPAGILEITPVLEDQELDGTVTYWEGAVDVIGRWDGKDVAGRGYAELTGYGARAPDVP